MTQQSLRDVIRGVAVKKLASVELDPEKSNQHELNGSRSMRQLFGEEASDTRRFAGSIVYLNDEAEAPLEVEDLELTWYDARASHPNRTEWRLYFNVRNGFGESLPGDTLFTIRTHDDHVLLVIAEQGSTIESQLHWLFSFTESDSESTAVHLQGDLRESRVGLVEVALLEALGIEVDDSEDDALDLLVERFGSKFPITRLFSKFAREYSGARLEDADPDTILVQWIQTEERLFRTFEKHLLMPLIPDLNDVDEFLSLSLSVQNRRKSRAGRALENHLVAVLDEFNVRYSHGAITENKSRPDFLFPGHTEYHDPDFPVNHLWMLGAKSTLKDRWRQVLAEAKRIPKKHLITLDVAVSDSQMAEMRSQSLQLVVPSPLQVGYSESQRSEIWSLHWFLDEITASQTKLN